MNRREFCVAIGAALALGKPARPHTSSPAFYSEAQTEVFAANVFRKAGDEAMPYRLFVPPGYDKRTKYPLVLWLHGGAGRGTDNLKQISGGNTIGSHVWTRAANQAKHPCFVVAPQCPDEASWSTFDTVIPGRQLEMVLELLQELQKTYSLDPKRFYVTGQSLGGFGTWAIVSQHPEMFAAAMPVCGGGNESAAKLIKTPIWAFHGEKDQTVRVERSRQMIAAIKQAGGSPKYTEYAGEGHAIWEKVFSEPELLPWVFAQKNN